MTVAVSTPYTVPVEFMQALQVTVKETPSLVRRREGGRM